MRGNTLKFLPRSIKIMLKFFFGKTSWFVNFLEALGLLLNAVVLYRMIRDGAGKFEITAFVLFAALYGFFKFCATFRFYKNVPKYSGIELHFKKIQVAANYVIAIAGLIGIVHSSATLYLTAAIFLAIVAHINVILIFLHLRDEDVLPPNSFTRKVAK